jgi:hypothetical protein
VSVDPDEDTELLESGQENEEGEPLGKPKMPPVPLPDPVPHESNSDVQ